MNTPPPVKKPLPYSVSKSTLVEMYIKQKPEKRILDQINEILKERGFPITIKQIEHNEFMEYVATYGVPEGYYITDDD